MISGGDSFSWVVIWYSVSVLWHQIASNMCLVRMLSEQTAWTSDSIYGSLWSNQTKEEKPSWGRWSTQITLKPWKGQSAFKNWSGSFLMDSFQLCVSTGLHLQLSIPIVLIGNSCGSTKGVSIPAPGGLC
jgi:hypothetical protein